MLEYRKCTAMIVIKNCKIFLGERISPNDAWQFPQGGLKKNEEFIDAAKRELYEETSIKSVEFIDITKKSYLYNFTNKSQKHAIKKYGNIRYLGQSVRFCVFKFFGEDSEINIQTEHPEFKNWKWGTQEEILEKIVSFKKKIYEDAFNELEILKDYL